MLSKCSPLQIAGVLAEEAPARYASGFALAGGVMGNAGRTAPLRVNVVLCGRYVFAAR